MPGDICKHIGPRHMLDVRWVQRADASNPDPGFNVLCYEASNVMKHRFYDREVSAALDIRRIAAGPGRPRELNSWLSRPAMPNPGTVGQEWVKVAAAAPAAAIQCFSNRLHGSWELGAGSTDLVFPLR
ncbi:hypothetical protein QJQ45_018441 [Haematococcus lacustris]|nr:hypothetical protein QJQ45_018441 [Haematococcus lacustris]